MGWPDSKDILLSYLQKYNEYSGGKRPMGKLRCRWDNDAWRITLDLFQTQNWKVAARVRKDWLGHGPKTG